MSSGSDLEKDGIFVRELNSYPSLAEFIAEDHDHSTVIYKRFDRLAARNLLYLQSELADLQARQDEYDREDLQDTRLVEDYQALRKAGRDWPAFVERAESHAKFKNRIELVELIRKKMKQYREAMILESAVLSLRRPSKQAHRAFENSFNNMGFYTKPSPCLGSSSENLYEDRQDLAALARVSDEDRLTKFLRNNGSLLFTRRRQTNHALAYGSQNTLSFIVGAVNIILAAGFLFGAIYNLHKVQRDQVKLGLIAGYTTAFALCIALVTNARRSEIFGACAAYAAVLVVFVSGSLDTNSAH